MNLVENRIIFFMRKSASNLLAFMLRIVSLSEAHIAAANAHPAGVILLEFIFSSVVSVHGFPGHSFVYLSTFSKY